MAEFVDILTAYPTVVFTVLLGVALLYWLLVILGAVDIDALDPSGLFHGVDGALDGALDGAADGAVEGAQGIVEGAIHGAADGAAEGAAGALDGAELHHEVGEAAGLLSALGLKGVPITIILSVTVAVAWLACGMTMDVLGRSAPAWLQAPPFRWVGGTVVALAALALGLVVSSVVLRPLRFAVRTEQGRSRRSLVGRVGIVTTQRVDEGFGQAEVHVDGDYVLVDVRSDEPNELRKGSQVLLYDYDATHELFRVVAHRPD
jgi:membrane protein implicated in regulation of membrane protease activity